MLVVLIEKQRSVNFESKFSCFHLNQKTNEIKKKIIHFLVQLSMYKKICFQNLLTFRGPYFKGCDNVVFDVIWFEFVRFLIWFNCIFIFLKKEHGCCPDGKTKSRGPDFRGCDNATPCKGWVISECIFLNFSHPQKTTPITVAQLFNIQGHRTQIDAFQNNNFS